MEFEHDYEILEFAIAREVEAHQFYVDIAAQMENTTLRKLFEHNAQEELKHKAKLELEMIKLGRTVDDPAEVATLQGEKPSIMIDPDLKPPYEDALILGMQREKKSFRIYVELAAMVKDKESFETLLDIAEEEVRHMLMFEMQYGRIVIDGGQS